MTVSGPHLVRQLGLPAAVVVGVGSMVGAGVFVVFGPATAAAGGLLLPALAVAALVAWCNAISTAQLAASHPQAGGVYAFGRAELGPVWGFAAGWCFVIGKLASAAAMALAAAAYLAPPGWQRPIAALVVVTLVTLNLAGVRRTTHALAALLTVALTGLAVVLVTGATAPAVPQGIVLVSAEQGWRGAAQGAALLFFAFAGYARLATLGEEVRDPRRVIPRAIAGSLAAVTVLYGLLAWVLLRVLGAEQLALSLAPLEDLVRAAGHSGAVPVVVAAAAAACCGSLLALLAGVSRTSFAMAREHDLPRPLARVSPRRRTPWVADLTIGAVVLAVVLWGQVHEVIGFSSFGVLLYYAVAHLSAFAQDPSRRRSPRLVQLVGLVMCVALATQVPPGSLIAGVGVLMVGLIGRAAGRSLRLRPQPR